MPGPPPVRLIEPPAWAKALCAAIHGAPDPPPPPPPPPEWGTGGPGAPGSDANPLTQGQAVVLFEFLDGQEHIPHTYAREYCFARAHEMCRIMTALGIESRKVWNFCNNFDSEHGPWDDQGNVVREGAIRVEHPAQGTILWVYHVAPTVSVTTPQGQMRLVLDPSLLDGPAPEDLWMRQQDAPHSFREESGPEFYTPGTRDDDYSRTERDLEAARNSRDAWDHGIVPPEEPIDAIVPEEGSEEIEEEPDAASRRA